MGVGTRAGWILVATLLVGVPLAGCSAPAPTPPEPSPTPSVVASTDGDWTSQAVGGTTLITTSARPDVMGHIPFYGALALTADGCFGLQDRTSPSTLVFLADTRLMDGGAFEIGGHRFAVGDLVQVSGGGSRDTELPAPCGTPAAVLLVNQMRPMSEDEVRQFSRSD